MGVFAVECTKLHGIKKDPTVVRTPRGLMVSHHGLAQSLGFEPRVGYQPTHDFQSCGVRAAHQ